MPTNEQRKREQFEKWAETESFDLTANIHTGKYIYSDTLTAWLTWLARDAEVQALRELLYEIKFKAGMSHINETMEQQQRLLYDISDAARAALAGGETGETE